MQVYITGDCHGDYRKFSKHLFPEQEELSKDDIVIVCGDFGIWDRSRAKDYVLEELSNRSFTTVFVDGNHENFDRLDSDEFEVVPFFGGKAHKIKDNIYHLMRGYVFKFAKKKFFVMGGASSHDIQDGILDREDFDNDKDFRAAIRLAERRHLYYRVNHYSWWEKELPSKAEMKIGIKSLEENKWKVDYVISHSLPQSVVSILGYTGQGDSITRYFDMLIDTGLKFQEWHAGHYHMDGSAFDTYFIHYRKIERLI